MRSLHLPGRSAVYARNAMCATSHPLASQTALSVLKDGGNAVDAAIAATAVLCVVEPAMTGIGGDCFALVVKPGEKPIALNASGRAPAALTAEHLLENGITEIVTESPHAVTAETKKTEQWRSISEQEYKKKKDALGMVVEHKPAGKYDNESERVTQPPGYSYVAPPGRRNRYGYWGPRHGGGSFWHFYGQYAFMSHMLGGPRHYVTPTMYTDSQIL